MMNDLKLFFFLILSSFIMGSCGSDDDDNPGGFDCNSVADINQQLDDVLNALDVATNAYIDDPSDSSKCTEWKNAYADYLNALEGFEDCYIELGQQSTYQQSLDAAQVALAGIPC